MYITVKQIALACFLMVLLQSSCTKILDDELPQKEPKLVINGLINPDSILKINISKTFHVFEDESSNNLPFIEGASTKVFEDGQFLFNLEEEENGYYTKADFYPLVNHTYKVEVEKSGYTAINAETVIPATVTINSLDTLLVIEEDEYYYNKKLECTLKYDDPEGVDNYFRLDCYIIYSDENGDEIKYREYISVDENDEYLFDKTYNYLLWSDLLSQGNEVSVKFNIYLNYYYGSYEITETDSTTYVIVLSSVSEEFYKYDKSRSLFFESGGSDNPFSEPVLIYSNVINGFGVFGGHSTDSVSFQYIYEYNYQNQ